MKALEMRETLILPAHRFPMHTTFRYFGCALDCVYLFLNLFRPELKLLGLCWPKWMQNFDLDENETFELLGCRSKGKRECHWGGGNPPNRLWYGLIFILFKIRRSYRVRLACFFCLHFVLLVFWQWILIKMPHRAPACNLAMYRFLSFSQPFLVDWFS